MQFMMKALCVCAVATAALVIVPQESQAADRYWRGYWSWYDNTYHPYVYRSYSYTPQSRYYTYTPTPQYYQYYDPYDRRDYRYDYRYDDRYEDRTARRGRYYDGYYDNRYYDNQPRAQGGVRVGPLQFQWY